MKQILLSILTATLLTGTAEQLKADSPLTSTNFAAFYTEYEIVEYAMNNQVLDQKVIDYLISDKNPLDVKAAVINALSWTAATDRHPDFLAALTQKYGTSDMSAFSPGDLA